MKKNETRKFKGKDEELSVMAGYVAFSFERDLKDFSAYAPKFTISYTDDLKKRITNVIELVSPKTETNELRLITKQLYTLMDNLAETADHLKGYLKLAKSKIPLTATQFGITLLKQKVRSRDSEGVLQAQRAIMNNVEKYKDALKAFGLKDTLVEQMKILEKKISEANQQQYVIVSRRKELVQSNISVLNDLYDEISEICAVGKILYKGKDAQKVQEYTYSELLKRVRLVQKSKKEKEN